jgi:hypothetical protein
MTIDSAYQLELYSPDNEREYFFEFESTGDTTFILWVDYVAGGVAARESFPAGTYAFDIEFEGRGPIYKRGKITLTDAFFVALAGAQITRLTMQRKTPIINDVEFETDGEFTPESFEFAADKLCMIQQEIEGHYCDCREKAQGLDPIEDAAEGEYYEENPECRPYECDALKQIAGQSQYYWPCDNNPDVDLYLEGTVNIDVAPAGANHDLLTSGVWLPGGCDAIRWSSGTNITAKDDSNDYGISIPSPSYNAFMVWRGGTAGTQRPFRFILNYAQDGSPSAVWSHEATLSVVNSGTTLRLTVGATGSGFSSFDVPFPLDGEPHLIGFAVTGPDTLSGGNVTRNHTYAIHLDGELAASGDYTVPPLNPSTTQYSFVPNSDFDRIYFAQNGQHSDILLNADIAALNAAWKRNRTDYTTPEYCIFPQG